MIRIGESRCEVYGHSVCVCVCARAKSPQSCPTLCNPMDYSPIRPLCPWDSPGKKAGVGCHVLFQGIFPTRGLNPGLLCLLHWQAGFFPTSATWEASGTLCTTLQFFYKSKSVLKNKIH